MCARQTSVSIEKGAADAETPRRRRALVVAHLPAQNPQKTTGLETADFAPHGLWTQEPLLKQLDQIAGPSCGFNALRIPFSCELALNLDARFPTNIDYGANPQLKGLSSGAVLDYLVSECAKRGIVILLDMHRMEAAGDIPELWYSPKHPESAVATAWRLMAKRYAPCWNVIGADLNNEPHGCATWEPGQGNVATNWRAAAERLGRVVLEANPRLLIFVEGVERCLCTGDGSWWGGHLGDAAEHPVNLPVKDKLVYSPHVYGPDVHEQVYFGSAGFEKFLPKIWREHFAFAVCDPKKRLGPAVVPGEWGGFARQGTKDAVWQETIAKWMGSDESGIESSFHWCWQCNSGDTGEFLFCWFVYRAYSACLGEGRAAGLDVVFEEAAAKRRGLRFAFGGSAEARAKTRCRHPRLFPLSLVIFLPLTRPTRRVHSGGIVADDWSTLQEHKLANVRRAHPRPTPFPKQACAPPDASVTREQCDLGALEGGVPDPSPKLCGFVIA